VHTENIFSGSSAALQEGVVENFPESGDFFRVIAELMIDFATSSDAWKLFAESEKTFPSAAAEVARVNASVYRWRS